VNCYAFINFFNQRKEKRMIYQCRNCKKKGNVSELRNHYCGERGHVRYENDDYLLTTLIVMGAMGGSFDSPVQSNDSPSQFDGFSGGESGGGGAIRDFDPSPSSDFSSDSGSSSCGGND
jgi:hypothetical protein